MVFNNFQHFSTSQDSEDLVYFGLVLRQNPAQLVFQDHRLRRRWSVSTADPRMAPSAGSRSLETCRSSGMVRVTAVALQAIYGGYSHFDGEWGSETEWDFGGPVFRQIQIVLPRNGVIWVDFRGIYSIIALGSQRIWIIEPSCFFGMLTGSVRRNARFGSFVEIDLIIPRLEASSWKTFSQSESRKDMSQTHLWQQTCLKGRTAPMPWHCLGNIW